MSYTNLISKADISKVDQGFATMKTQALPNNTILSLTNQLSCNNPADVLKNHSTNSLSNNDVKEFIAISTIAHTIDGWSYISNAIHSLIKGEPSIAIHLAYYAELRAALAFLATEDILLLDKYQACIESNDNLYITSLGGTHIATWNIIDEWVSRSNKPTNVLKYFSYQGQNFEQLSTSIPYVGTLASTNIFIIKNWLKTWCFDIQNFKDDKLGRNQSSYNPNVNRFYTPASLRDKMEMINVFWKVLQPVNDSFDLLDRHLFSFYLNEIYSRLSTTLRSSVTKADFIDDFFTRSGLSPDYILRNIFTSGNVHPIIQTAMDTQIDTTTNEIKPLTIIARAILFLRFCSGANSFYLNKNNIQRSEMDFYINKIGDDFGLWSSSSPNELKDLWLEIEFLLEDFENFFAASSVAPNIYDIRQEFKDYSETYIQFSRASLWGLGI